jgi:hypothetical protein
MVPVKGFHFAQLESHNLLQLGRNFSDQNGGKIFMGYWKYDIEINIDNLQLIRVSRRNES